MVDTRRNGLPEPEVIVNVRWYQMRQITQADISPQFADGWSYSKGKMEEALRAITENPPAKPSKPSGAFKKEDVDYIACLLSLSQNFI